MKKILNSMMALAIATMTFTACEDVPAPYETPGTGGNTVITPETIGSIDEPITVAKALELIDGYSSGGSSTTDAYVKGIISQVQSFNANYSSITYYISDDGKTQNEIQCYSGKGLNGADFTAKDNLKPGTTVIVKGKLKKYVNNSGAVTAELDQSNQIVYMGEVPETPEAEAKGDGSLANPFNAAAANKEAAKLADKQASEESYYIKGKVASIAYNYGEGRYTKTADYYISDDGTNANTFYVYASKYLGNTDYSTGDVLKEGDEVIIYGKLYNYGGTLETSQNNSYLYSLNGKTEATGGQEPEPQPTGEIKTVTVAEFNATAESDEVWYQLTGTVKNLKDGDIYGNFDLEDATGSVYVYGLLSEKGGEKKKFQELVAAKGITEGCKLTIIGNRGSYQGKIEVLNAYFVSIEGGGEQPGDDDTPASEEGTYSQPFSVNDVIAKGTSASTPNVYVKAYIVGYVDGQVFATGAKYTSEGAVASNLLIADAADEKEVEKCIPVQLPTGAVRTGLNLKDNPSLIGKQVILYGNLEKYFGVAGMKSVSYAECDGKEIGSKP